MLNDELKTQIANRLTRIQGQLGGVRKMVDGDRYCMDILVQTRAISAALKAVEDLVMENHLNTCVSDAMINPDPVEKEEKIGELMEIISKFRKG